MCRRSDTRRSACSHGPSDTAYGTSMGEHHMPPRRIFAVALAAAALVASCGMSSEGAQSEAPTTWATAPRSTETARLDPTASADDPTASPTASTVAATPTAVASPAVLLLTYPGPLPNHKISVRVHDASHSLNSIRASTSKEDQLIALWPDTIGVETLKAHPNSLYVRWSSALCAGRHEVLISPDARALEVREPPRAQCDAVGTFVSIVLTFDHPVDGASVLATVTPG